MQWIINLSAGLMETVSFSRRDRSRNSRNFLPPEHQPLTFLQWRALINFWNRFSFSYSHYVHPCHIGTRYCIFLSKFSIWPLKTISARFSPVPVLTFHRLQGFPAIFIVFAFQWAETRFKLYLLFTRRKSYISTQYRKKLTGPKPFLHTGLSSQKTQQQQQL